MKTPMKKEIKEKIIEILKNQCKEDDAYIKIDKPTDQILELFEVEKQKSYNQGKKEGEKEMEDEDRWKREMKKETKCENCKRVIQKGEWYEIICQNCARKWHIMLRITGFLKRLSLKRPIK